MPTDHYADGLGPEPCGCSSHLRVAALEKGLAEAVRLIRELRSWMHDCGGCHGGRCSASCKAAKFFLAQERAFLAKHERGAGRT